MKELYISIDTASSEDGPKDFKVVQNSPTSFDLTDMTSGNSQTVNLSSFDFSYNSLVKMDIAG